MVLVLQVMDTTAISLCKDNRMPIIVFNLRTPGHLRRAVLGERVVGAAMADPALLDELGLRFPFGGISFGAFRGALFADVGGAWDDARRRVVFADGGDIVVVDTVARTRQQVTRTTAPESSPRWARHASAQRRGAS